jgi:hypothetical protein
VPIGDSYDALLKVDFLWPDGLNHVSSIMKNITNYLCSITILFLGFSFNGYSQEYPFSDQQNSGNWVLNTEISDEFDGVALDENQWLIQGRNGEYQSNFIGRSPAQFSTENAILENGKLKILTKWEPDYNFTNDNSGNMLGTYGGVSKPITTAAVISKKKFKYGYMEIKSKAANVEVTSSFWTTGPGGANGASELDMFEMFGGHKTNDSWKKRLKLNMISWDPTNEIKIAQAALGKIGTTHTRNIQAANNTADDFHVYGFEWTAEYIKVYIDGVLHPDGTILKSVITNNGAEPDRWITDVDYWVWFDSETFPWLGLPDASDLVTPAEYQIEYIRVWQKQEGEITVTGTTNATEGVTDGIFTVGLPNGVIASQDIDITYTVGGSAIEGIDYSTIARTVTIISGTNSSVIVIDAVEDEESESTETVTITLLSSNAASVSSTEASIDVFDASPPAVFSAGDIAIVGYKAASGNIGELAFVILKEMSIGTSISFSNRSWHDDGSFNLGGGTPYGIDDVFSWTSANSYNVGTIFKLGRNGKVTTMIGATETEVGTTVQTFGSDNDWDLSPSGDSVLVYSGNTDLHPDDNSSNWITALNTDGKSTVAGWQSGGGNSYCELPAALVGYDIDVTGGDFSLNLWDKNYGVYTGALSGTPSLLRASMNDGSNWTLSEDTEYNLWRFNLASDNVSGDIGSAGSLSLKNQFSQELSIFPNPVKDYLYFKGDNINIAIIEVYSALGNILMRIDDFKTDVNLSNLVKGLYIAKVIQKSGAISTHSFVKG